MHKAHALQLVPEAKLGDGPRSCLICCGLQQALKVAFTAAETTVLAPWAQNIQSTNLLLLRSEPVVARPRRRPPDKARPGGIDAAPVAAAGARPRAVAAAVAAGRRKAAAGEAAVAAAVVVPLYARHVC